MTKGQKKTSEDVGDFVCERVQKTSGFILDRGFVLVEKISLFTLQRIKKNVRMIKVVHSKAPLISFLFNNFRKSSTILPFMLGRIARKSTVTGIKMGVEMLKFSGKFFNLGGRK